VHRSSVIIDERNLYYVLCCAKCYQFDQGESMKPIIRAIRAFSILAIMIALSNFKASAAPHAVTIHSPLDGMTVVAEACPSQFCTGDFSFEVEVTGAPMDEVVINFMHDTSPGFSFEQPLCLTDPIENEDCPAPPETFTKEVSILVGEWTVNVTVKRGAAVETSATIHLTVLPPNVILPGTVTLSTVEPNEGTPPIVVRDPGLGDPDGLSTTTTQVEIIGTNLHNNSFIEVYLAPIPVNEPSLTLESGLPTSEWCMFQAEIISRGLKPDGESYIRVKIPEIPLETSTVY
jgi:hypothetical protein